MIIKPYSGKIPVTDEYAKDLEIIQEVQSIYISDFLRNFREKWDEYFEYLIKEAERKVHNE